MKYKLGLWATLFLLAACGSRVHVMEWNASGGSRADGTVKLVAETRTGWRYLPSTNQADALAANRCKAWGYRGAEAFGGSTRSCISSNVKGCLIWENTRVYQCTGSGSVGQNNHAQPVVVNMYNNNAGTQTNNPQDAFDLKPIGQ